MALFGLNVDIDDGLCATVIWFGRKCGGGAIGRSHEAQAVELAFDWFVKMSFGAKKRRQLTPARGAVGHMGSHILRELPKNDAKT